MSYLFPVNRVENRADTEKVNPIEKIGDDNDDFSQGRGKDQHPHEKELDKKVKSLLQENEFSKALKDANIDPIVKLELLKIAKDTAASFLKKELLNVAKSILSLSELDEDDLDDLDDDLSLSEQLARLVMKLAKDKPKCKSVKNKVALPKAADDKNAGFLVHYCNNILNKKIKVSKNYFKSQKLKRDQLDRLFKR